MGTESSEQPCASKHGYRFVIAPTNLNHLLERTSFQWTMKTFQKFILLMVVFGLVIVWISFLAGKWCAPQVRLYFSSQQGNKQGLNFSIESTVPDTKPRLPRDPLWLNTTSGSIGTDDHTCPSKDPFLDKTSTTTHHIRKRFHELLVHPLLLNIEPEPISVALSLPQSEVALTSMLADEVLSYCQEIVKHKSISKIWITTENNNKQACEMIHKELMASQTIRSDVSIHCTNFESFEDAAVTVDAVIMPWLPHTFLKYVKKIQNYDNEDEDGYTSSAEAEEEDEDEESEIEFWHHYLSPNGAIVTVMGTTFPMLHINEFRVAIYLRWEYIRQLQETPFSRIIDFDVPGSFVFDGMHNSKSLISFFPVNVAVAFKNRNGMANWRRNQAIYNVEVRVRLLDNGMTDMLAFDSSSMLQLLHPPSHSSWVYCENYSSKSGCDFHGYDPRYPNVPLTDLYVSKSKAGEFAGRGVFANVDIEAESNIALETTVQSIHYEWPTTKLHREMMEDVPEYSDGTAKIVHIYAEAYGYASDPWGKPQETVMSHFLTFVNHGCNGTSNLGERGVIPSIYTEFNIDLAEGIPKELRTTISDSYDPTSDRDYTRYSTNCVAARKILKGEELYDNYMNFGGDDFFDEMVLSLRHECSGGVGLVEEYQSGSNKRNPIRRIDRKTD